ncbi:hypothetical protein [Paenibacillus kobensis]|uniref:hypothetical protein n=1 Tax=Paenibacillus kobensis TaxID=59841 RepID=UPI000FDA9ACB|nr:hypothetical protein [Paenibacillus kobensis]
MSDWIIKLIPNEPEYVPTDMNLEKVKEWFALSLAFEKANYIMTDEVRFIDQGRNFESVSCPICSNILDLGWWGAAMDKASETSFQKLDIITYCCNSPSLLSELIYKGNAGFARFSIEIMNPKRDITKETIANLEYLLGCSMLKVEAYY